jgi:hypothetical protein
MKQIASSGKSGSRKIRKKSQRLDALIRRSKRPRIVAGTTLRTTPSPRSRPAKNATVEPSARPKVVRARPRQKPNM